MNAKLKGMLLMFLCALMWSLSGLYVKLIPWPGLALAGWRGVMTTISIFAFMRYRKLSIIINKSSVLTGVCTALCIFFYFAALKRTTAANAITLQYTMPVFLLVLSALFLHKRFKRADYIAVAMTMCGIVLFFVGDITVGDMLGNALALISGIAYAASYMFMGEADIQTRLSGLMIGSLFAGAGVFTAAPWELELSPLIIVMVLLIGFVQIALPYILLGYAMKLCSPLMCSLIASFEIILNPVWVFLATGELPGLWSFIGALVIIVTITAWCALDARGEKQAAKTSG